MANLGLGVRADGAADRQVGDTALMGMVCVESLQRLLIDLCRTPRHTEPDKISMLCDRIEQCEPGRIRREAVQREELYWAFKGYQEQCKPPETKVLWTGAAAPLMVAVEFKDICFQDFRGGPDDGQFPMALKRARQSPEWVEFGTTITTELLRMALSSSAEQVGWVASASPNQIQQEQLRFESRLLQYLKQITPDNFNRSVLCDASASMLKQLLCDQERDLPKSLTEYLLGCIRGSSRESQQAVAVQLLPALQERLADEPLKFRLAVISLPVKFSWLKEQISDSDAGQSSEEDEFQRVEPYCPPGENNGNNLSELIFQSSRVVDRVNNLAALVADPFWSGALALNGREKLRGAEQWKSALVALCEWILTVPDAFNDALIDVRFPRAIRGLLNTYGLSNVFEDTKVVAVGAQLVGFFLKAHDPLMAGACMALFPRSISEKLRLDEAARDELKTHTGANGALFACLQDVCSKLRAINPVGLDSHEVAFYTLHVRALRDVFKEIFGPEARVSVLVIQELYSTCEHLTRFSAESGALELIHLLGGVLDSRNRPRFFARLYERGKEGKLRENLQQEVAYLRKEIARCRLSGDQEARSEEDSPPNPIRLLARKPRGDTRRSDDGAGPQLEFGPNFYVRYLVVRDLLRSFGLEKAVPALTPEMEQRAIESAAFSDRMGQTEISPMVGLDDLLSRAHLEQSRHISSVGGQAEKHAKAWRLIRYLFTSAESVEEFGVLYHRLEPYLGLLGLAHTQRSRRA